MEKKGEDKPKNGENLQTMLFKVFFYHVCIKDKFDEIKLSCHFENT